MRISARRHPDQFGIAYNGEMQGPLAAFTEYSATIGVAGALTQDLHAVMAVFGVWAIVAGLFQLMTGARRWKIGAQWAMILAGAQSALVGAFFIKQALETAPVGITDIAPYAAFGALYFFISAVWLTVAQARRRVSGQVA